MKRRTFIRNSCQSCLSIALAGLLPVACTTNKYISGRLAKNGLYLDPKEFETRKNGSTTYLQYIIIRNPELKFPIAVYRFSEQEYTALWMQCAHQGAELMVMGSFLQCPAHGSEYDSKGRVTNGPAISDLRSFPASLQNHQLFIDLRKT